MKTRIKWLISIFILTVIVSVFMFIKYGGYEGMFDFLKKEKDRQIIKTEKKIVEQEQTFDKIETTYDTIYIYRVILGSFKIPSNATNYAKNFEYSDIIIKNGFNMVSNKYYFNLDSALVERNRIGRDTWVLKETLIIEI